MAQKHGFEFATHPTHYADCVDGVWRDGETIRRVFDLIDQADQQMALQRQKQQSASVWDCLDQSNADIHWLNYWYSLMAFQ